MTDQAVPQPLPAPLDGFVGRDQEIAAAARLATSRAVRLLTLVGPGGVGKTRLALRVAAEAASAFPDGVVFAPLAELHDADLLPSAIAQALGLRGAAGHSLDQLVRDHLAARRRLLVLDNLEQLLPAAGARIAALLLACPELTVLATSRALLRITGEHAFPVLPLGVPPTTKVEPDGLDRYAAVQLLLARGQRFQPDLRLTPENAAAVAGLCRRLEGVPLALELAAAWLRIFSPAALLGRLERRLPLLVGGARDQPERHATMRAAIAWSFDLLDPAEQRRFRRLSVFAGGCTLETATTVAGDETSEAALAGVAALCDASLLHRIDGPDGEPRFSMLETIREYAREQSEIAGEQDAVQREHAAVCLALAERAAGALLGPAHGASFDRLETEHANLRAALAWAMEPEPAWALRIAASLAGFWGNRGHLEEGQRWLERALSAGETAPAGPRAAALFGLAWLRWASGDNDRAERAAAESLVLATAADEVKNIVWARYLLGRIAGSQGRWQLAAQQLTASLGQCRQQGNPYAEAIVLHHLGVAVFREGDWTRADVLLREAVARNRDLQLTWGVAWSLNSLSLVARARHDDVQARRIYRESLGVLGDGDETYAVMPLAGMARLAADAGHIELAVRVAAAVVARRDRIGLPVWELAAPDLDQALARGRAQLRAAFETVRSEGAAWSLAEAIGEALALPDVGSAPGPHVDRDDLTPREHEVLALLATGASNQAIADALSVSLATVKSHVVSILAKLGVSTRTAAAHHVRGQPPADSAAAPR